MTNSNRSSDRPRTGLVLSGGGARGAYQVGVLMGLIDQGLISRQRSDFEIIVGASAGALNGAMLASHADRMGEGIAALEHMWGHLEAGQVFRTDLRSLGGIGMKWVRDLSFGGALRRVAPKSLLDTSPLRDLVTETIPFGRIASNIENGALDAVALPATDLYTGNGIEFVQTRSDVPLWQRGRWRIERTEIGADHVMASSAIPIFFPSVEIDGYHLGDGSVRNTAPLSPAIRLGADRIVAIGVRAAGAIEEEDRSAKREPPSVAQIAGALLDAVMLDAIEIDVEHSARVNTSVIASPTNDPNTPFRWIDVLWLRPSRAIGPIAAELSDRIPAIVRYLMRGLGSDESTTELASYLLFDAAFCNQLIEIGVADVEAKQDEIRRFFARPKQPPGSAPVSDPP